jgi:D-3-phosphoglycerate dehydrogenase
VLVTPRSFGRGNPELRTRLEREVAEVHYMPSAGLSSADLISLVGEIDGWIAGLDFITREVLEHAPRLRVIARYGVGTDRIDINAAQARNVVVTATPGANADAVAELVLAFIFALARRLTWADREVRSGHWPAVTGATVSESTLGIVGLGWTGRRLAAKARTLGCTVIAHDPAISPDVADRHGVGLLDLPLLLERADFVSLHVPLTKTTERFVDETFLARMRPGAYLINAARGDLVDERALAQALDSGHLAGAALDVHSREPLAPDPHLLEHPNVILTPHFAAHTAGAHASMGSMALHDCIAVLRGLEPSHPVPAATVRPA